MLKNYDLGKAVGGKGGRRLKLFINKHRGHKMFGAEEDRLDEGRKITLFSLNRRARQCWYYSLGDPHRRREDAWWR